MFSLYTMSKSVVLPADNVQLDGGTLRKVLDGQTVLQRHNLNRVTLSAFAAQSLSRTCANLLRRLRMVEPIGIEPMTS